MHHTFVALVDDKRGALDRVVSLFRRLNYNVVSLTAGPCEKPSVTRLTVVIDASPDAADRIRASMRKLRNVLRVDSIDGHARVTLELAKEKSDMKTNAKIFRDDDADLTLIQRKKVAIIGYGSQGRAHALNLKDSGADVRVGLRADSRSRQKVQGDGLEVCSVTTVCQWADVVVMLAPDTAQPRIYEDEVKPGLTVGKTLMFAHGFNIHYRTVNPRADVDVAMIAPKAPGHRVREIFVEGGGVPALLAIHRDATQQARGTALSYAKALGCTRAGVIETTFAEETETDLFGEQAVLCGGATALVKAGFETLVDAGYQPEVAYFECLHELKLIVDLMYRGGLAYMRHSISDTAEYGDYVAGPRVVTAATRAEMKQILAEIQSGIFAKNWIQENEAGRENFEAMREREAGHSIEEVGAELRAAMPFLHPVGSIREDAALSARSAVPAEAGGTE